MEYALSSDDIFYLLDGKTNILTNRQLADVQRIEQILKDGACVILYETKDRSGHWCCVFKRKPDEIQWFDSYGLMPDSELTFIDRNFRRRSNQVSTHLTRLLIEWLNRTGGDVRYSQYRLQKLSNTDNTCGRFVVLRLRMRDLNEDEFAEVVPNSKAALRLTTE